MKTCPSCGTLLEDDTRFCTCCGALQPGQPDTEAKSIKTKKIFSASALVALIFALVIVAGSITFAAVAKTRIDNAYRQGFSDAYNTAFEDGKTDGLHEGKLIGYEDGHSAGVDEGKAAGLEEGKLIGYEDGHSAGVDEGKAAGLEEGKLIGYEDGHSAGVDEGKAAGLEEGKTLGYESGYADATAEYETAFEAALACSDSADYDMLMYYIAYAYEYGWSTGYDVAKGTGTDTSLAWAIESMSAYSYDETLIIGELLMNELADAIA